MHPNNPTPAGQRTAQGEADRAAVASAKSLLRQAVLTRREVRTAEERQRLDRARMGVLTSALSQNPPRTVAAYLSTGSEPATLQLVSWLTAHAIQVLLPVLSSAGARPGREPAWARYGGPDRLRVGRLSILEPTTPVQPATALAAAELVICPALTADLSGRRLGRGGGWYDRALAFTSSGVPVWALVNDDEVLKEVPTHAWDWPLDSLVTESRLIRCGVATDA